MMEFSATGGPEEYLAGTTTGRYLVLFEGGAAEAGIAALTHATGARRVAATDDVTEPEPNEALFFEQLGVAVVDTNPQQMRQAGVEPAAQGIIAVEPERINEAFQAPGTVEDVPATARSVEYLQGYRDAVLHLTAPAAGDLAEEAGLLAVADETQATWGLQAVRAVNSSFSGEGIRVAILDTGCDLKHPDFAGRAITDRSFIPGEAVQDANGHGTHCIGTSMGLKTAPTGPRYGVAYDAEIYAGKVLSDAGSGSDSQILGGIEWAIRNKCAVVSMSLGARTSPGQGFSRVFEAVAARAQDAGTLIIAAAGNDSNRPTSVIPVSHPANCPSIMAVAALDSSLKVARFSNRGINPSGGQIDIAAPGVDVYSSFPMATRYRRLSGTSMATPHVAGVAALLAQANPGARGAALWQLVTTRARRLALLSSADVGAGLVQAP
ncbi:MAG: S8 family serine peptidase [Solirubrobacteraceae bacterium MAG38_C4-C5]|nr:S8 family serine peptidase [Candidatus Siliceabacter maunaloa]